MRFGWIGLGRMGRPMITNLIRKGFDVTVQNRTQEKLREFTDMGAVAGASMAEMASTLDVVHLCLPGGVVDEVVNASDGVLAGARPGLIIVDHSTTDPEVARSFAQRAAAKGARFIDAPVSGSGPVAERGELTIMAGGDVDAFATVLPALDAMGRTVRLMGPAGSGMLTKIINNLIMSTTLAVSYEGIVLGTKAGIDPKAMFEVIGTASGASRAWERNIPMALTREFSTQGAVYLLAGDLLYAGKLASEYDVPMPVTMAGNAFWQSALAAGIGQRDPGYAITVVEQAAGVVVQGAQEPRA